MKRPTFLLPLCILGLAMVGCRESSDFTMGPTGGPGGIRNLDGYITDTFVQEYSKKVDILWVIDNSGSMGNNQDQIRDNSKAFSEKFNTEYANVDYQMIVTTTDVDDEGYKNQCGAFITPANPELLGTCADKLNTSGSGHEVGLESARRALDPALNQNPRFLRDGADLQLVFVSDEEDHVEADNWPGNDLAGTLISELLAGEMTSDLEDFGHRKDAGYGSFVPLLANYEAFFRGLKAGSQNKIRAHAIVTTSNTTCSNYSTEEIGQRYMTLAQRFEGSISDVCSDWSETMNTLGVQASGLDKCFPLSQVPPDPSSIIVMTMAKDATDATELPSGDWSYNPSANNVCFEKQIPGAGTTIVIAYK